MDVSASRNVEIKAVLHDATAAHTISASLSGSTGTLLHQQDVFYTTPKGRLKMRTVRKDDENASEEELIYYERPDTHGPKTSTFHKVESSGVAGVGLSSLHELLTDCMGVRGTVTKQRTLYIIGQTRVHIDCVEGLGNYLELEVMLQPEQSEKEGQTIAEDLMGKLGIKETDLLHNAYMDIIENNKT